MLIQTSFEFLYSLNTEEGILKNVDNQRVDGSHWLPLYGKNTMEVNGYRQLSGYTQSSIYIIQQCSTEETNRFGAAREWVNDNRILIFG